MVQSEREARQDAPSEAGSTGTAIPPEGGRFHLVLVIPSLACGGSERAVSLLAGRLAARQRVTVVTLDDGTRDFFTLAEGVQRRALGLLHSSRGTVSGLLAGVRRVLALRRALSALEPDAVVSFLAETNVLAVLATRGLGLPVVTSERTDPRVHRLSPVWRRLVRAAYRRADRVVANSRSVAEWIGTWMPAERVEWIPNGVELAATRRPRAGDVERPLLLAVGRLDANKGHAELIEAFADVPGQTAWRLVVLGEGPERAHLEELVRARGLEDRVELRGQVSDPTRVLAEAQVFALTSRYEGQPNALMEAMAAGLACVAYASAGGVSELLESEKNGLLVPVGDRVALTGALARLMDDDALRQRLGTEARAAIEPFEAGRVVERWERLLRDLLRRR